MAQGLQDEGDLVVVLDLHLLVVAAALVGRPPFEHLGEAVEDLGPPAVGLGLEVTLVVLHELEVDSVLLESPAA